MASWNGQYIGNANWQGSPQFASQTQLISSTQGVASQPQLTSTSAGLFNYTTGASNVLQGEINAIVATGTTALWANYKAINNVDLSGHDLINARYLSTLDLQVSSINGADIKLFGSTVVVGGVTIVNNTIKAGTVEKTTDIWDTINSAIGAAGNAVGVVQQAAGGFLQDVGSVIQSLLWTTYAVDKVVNLATDVTTLATGIQGLVDSRATNNISGGNVPGQSAKVYETFNGTTQFQFSTLGSATWTVFRTTDQTNPNMTLGKEIYISTIIPAGSKVIRSVGDPMALPILSTQLLSTTNYAQSFGQWAAILQPDYNLTASTLKADLIYGFASLSTGKISTTSLEAVNMNISNLLNTTNLYVTQNATVVGSLTSGSFATGVFGATNSIVTSLSTNTLSTGSVIVSSLNGLAFNSIIKGNDSSFNSLSTNKISTGIALISSINGLPISAFVTTGDINFNSISTNALSTGSATISSLNGLPISVYINSGDVVFNTVTANRISTARVWMSSINDVIKFTNQPYGNSIEGINDLAAATATFNTSLTTNGSLTAGTTLLGATRITGLFRVTNGSGFNVATINTSGDITGNSLTVNNAVSGNTGTYTGTLTAGNLTTAGTLSGAGLNVTGSASVSGVITGGSVTASGALTGASASVSGTATIATAAITTGNITTANITNGNITNTNTGIINAGAGSLALTYGSITFNGSPYAPTSPGGSDITVNSISTMKISSAQVFLSSINGYEYIPGGGGTLPPGLVSTPNLIGLVSTPNLLGLISTPNLRGLISTPNLLGLVSTANLLGLVSTPNLLGLLSTYVSSFNNFNISSLNVSSIVTRGALQFSTPIYEQNGSYDINKSYYLISSSYDAVSSFQNNILNYSYTLGLPAGALVSWPFPPSANLTLIWDEVGTWGNNTNTFAKNTDPNINQKQAQFSIPNATYGGTPVAGTYADFYNQWQLTKLTIYNIGFGVIVDIPWKSTYRVTWTGSTWTVNTSPSPIATTNTTNFNISQNINGAAISTSDVLTLTGTSIYMNTDFVYANDIEASNINIVSLSSFTGNVSTMTSYTTSSDYMTSYSTTTTYGASQTLSNTGTISTLTLGANTVSANYLVGNVSITAPSITAPSATIPTLNTNNIINTNTIYSYNISSQNIYAVGPGANGYMYADSAYTSTLVVKTGLPYPYAMIQTINSNTVPTSNYLVPPLVSTMSLYNQLIINSPNPSYEFNGTTGTVITFKLDTSVDVGGTVIPSFGFNQATFTTRAPIILNISTPVVGRFPTGSQITNLITTGGGTIALYTSGSGFLGSIPGATSLSLNYYGTDYNTGTFSNLAPISYQSYSQTTQNLNNITTKTNVSTITNAPYIGFGNKAYQIDTFQIRLQGFLISKTAGNGGAYGFADNGTRITNPITGRTYPLSDWNCICSLAGHNCFTQITLAVNEAIVTTESDSGYWKAHAYLTTPTIPLLPGGPNLVYWNIAVTMIPIEMGGITGLQTAANLGDVAPSTLDAFNPWSIDTPLANLSTVTGSTFQVIAGTNISLNAALGFPTFLNNGTVSINASTNVDLMANYDITLGAAHDINATATSNIRLTAPAIKLDVNDVNIHSYGSQAFRFVKESPYNYLQTVGRPMIITGLGGADSAFSFDGTGSNKSFRNLDMCNHDINNIGNEYFEYGGRFTSFVGGYGGQQGILDIAYPAAGTGHTNDGILRLFGGQANGDRVITLDSTNIGINVPIGYGNLYLNANTQVNGYLDMNNHPIYMGNATIYNANELYNNNTDLRLTGLGRNIIITAPNIQLNRTGGGSLILDTNVDLNCATGRFLTIGNFGGSFFQIQSGGSQLLENGYGCRQALNTDGSFEFRTTGANKTIYANTENMNFNGGSNNRITDLGHIYGNTASSGGGLTIDYMYGMFFNSAGNNANLYASGGNLNMTNSAGGTYIGVYSPAGTGNLSLYAASNDVIVATGAGHNIAINSGSNIYLNAAQPNGLLASYASTINSYSILDTNFTILQNLNITATGSAQLRASYFNFFNDCYFNSKDLHDITNLYRVVSGTAIAQPVLQYGTATGSGASGSVNVTLPVAYTSASSYVVFASMMDTVECKISVNRNSASNITIYWSQAGSGTQTLGWQTSGN